jgi:hypothetical protein
MAAPPAILELVERFDSHLPAYRSGPYNETQLRREFLDPFFKTLGWDVDNVQGYAEAYKDVVHEDAVKVGGATKAPDYGFRTQRELNFAVQRLIDRIIFLRIAEDRGLEEYGRLMALLNGTRVYERVGELFHRADDRYNSGLFHFCPEKGRPEPPDELTLRLQVDDKPLKEILKNLYYPDSPYEFSVLPADILGQVYERFLGKVIRLTAGHRAVVEDKPEVKKAGGVFYTPTYIVEFIVRQTVGKLLDLTPERRTLSPPSPKGRGERPIRVLDAACGSGSFLLGAYQYLLDWYRDGYIADGPEK